MADLKGDDVIACMITSEKKDDTYIWVKATGKVVRRDKNGNALLMVGNHEDVTEQIEDKNEILVAEAKAL